MKPRLSLSSYSLQIRGTTKSRKGFLLRVEFADLGFGYSDIFPWPEFGDPKAEDVPKLLEQEFSCPLFRQSLFFAEQDAKARAENRSLTDGIQLKNHFLITDLSQEWNETVFEAMERGFTTFKIKVGKDPDGEIAQLKKLSALVGSPSRVRFDFNTTATNHYLSALGDLGFNIEFIEDPFATSQQWHSNTMAFAFDQPGFKYEKVKAEWQIIKPARQIRDEIQAAKIVFTSSMDHPVGIAHALIQAAQFNQQVYDYGFMSHFIYEDTEFHYHLIDSGPLLSVESGLGIGFDSALIKQSWKELPW